MINKLLRVWFNSIEITKYLVVTDLQRGIGTTRNNNTLKNDTRDFEEYSGHTLGMKPIDMGFALIEDVIEKRRELADIFNVSKPAPLVFSDEPDVYYLAVPTGDIDFDDKKHYGEGTIFWLVPDGVAHAVDVKEFSNVNKEPVTIVSDFKNKTAGSLVECPHKLLFSAGTSLLNPNQFTAEVSDVHYRLIDTLDNQSWTTSSNGIGVMREILIPFNILETVKRAYPFLFEGLSESAQVEKLKKSITKLYPQAWAMGSGPNGNKVSFAVWNVWTWSASTPNTTNGIRKLAHIWNRSGSINAYINDKGILNMLLYADPSDGTTPSSVSLNYTNVEITIKLPNGQVVTIVNGGSYSSYPILEATVKGDNGLVGFINDNGGVLQFGSPDEVDGYDYQESETVVHETMVTQGNWKINEGEILYKDYQGDPSRPNLIGGSFDWTTNLHTAIPKYPVNNKGIWAGPTLHCVVPKNSKGSNTGNFEYKARFYFQTSVRGLARTQFQLQNGKEIPFGVILRDSDGTRKKIIIELWIHGEFIYKETLSMTKFNGNFFEIRIERFESELKITLNQIRQLKAQEVIPAQTYVKTINLASIVNVPVTHITQWVSKFADTPELENGEFTDTKFTWVNVDKWQDSPNRFSDGDVLRVDTSSGEILLNDVPEPSLKTRGNQWSKFELEKGTHNIWVVQSSWAEVPDVKGIIREAHL